VEKDWAQARRHFLYYGGTGNIQKGVDLLIEAFAAERRCHLHLAAPLEPELLKAYKTELSAPNIHYAHPRRLLPGRLQGIVKRCAFTVLCGFATGQSTALIGSLGSGLIPVVNREADIGNTGVRIKETSVAGVRAAICRAAELGPTELAALQRDAVDRFRTCHTPDAFRLGFRNAISSLFCA
jgi:glycosyltransferase involved in cell wall biosynthesis